jgi:hypothetical protein
MLRREPSPPYNIDDAGEENRQRLAARRARPSTTQDQRRVCDEQSPPARGGEGWRLLHPATTRRQLQLPVSL